jgi:hypothetical protein
LHNGTDACADCKGLAGPLKGALFRVVNTLLDKVLGNLCGGFLCAFNTAFGPSTSNAIYNATDSVAAEHFKKAERDKFRRSHNSAESGGLRALFEGGVFCAGALTCFTCTGTQGQTRSGKGVDSGGAEQTSKRTNAFGELPPNSLFETYIRCEPTLRAVANTADQFARWGFRTFRQQGGRAKRAGFK